MSIRIAVDIMGGDSHWSELLSGAVAAAEETGALLSVTATDEVIASAGKLPENVRLVRAGSVVEMTDEPSVVSKAKSDSTLAAAVNLCRDGGCDAVISAANTGALFTAASLTLRRIKGVRRAALATVVPLEKPFVLLDCGANLDATPDILGLYAHMGSIYAANVIGVDCPRVALINNGTESHKGTQLYRDAYELLSHDEHINFIGNVEGKDLPFGGCDVAVCDGFTGNITLKTIEGMATFMSRQIKGLFSGGPAALAAGALTLRRAEKLRRKLDPAEYGGAPFLGLAKPVIKAHGGSDAQAFRSAVKQAVKYTESGTIEKITAAIAQDRAEKEE